MSLYNDILKNLRKTGMLNLMEYRQLSRDEIDELGDDIRYWCTYGNGKLDKIGKEKKIRKIKRKNNLSLNSFCLIKIATLRQLRSEWH